MPPETWKARLDEARTAVIAETERARAGLAALARYSGQVDDIVQGIHESARRETDTPVALLAIGGYGRRQLCLHSDIDLMVVFDGRIGAAEERFLRAVLHPLWDMRLEVGHQVRELGDLGRAEADNPEFVLALVEARFVAGSRETHERVAATCLGPESVWRKPMRDALIELTSQRHAHFNRTVFQLEPDVKDSPGSLRDATAIRLLARLGNGAGSPVGYHPGRVREAEDFLLRIRSILHLERKRNYNGLGQELQETVAALFGSPGEQPQRQVEALMSTYFHHAQVVARALAASCARCRLPLPARTMRSPPPGTTWSGRGTASGSRTARGRPCGRAPGCARRGGARRERRGRGPGADVHRAPRQALRAGAVLRLDGRAGPPAAHPAPAARAL